MTSFAPARGSCAAFRQARPAVSGQKNDNGNEDDDDDDHDDAALGSPLLFSPSNLHRASLRTEHAPTLVLPDPDRRFLPLSRQHTDFHLSPLPPSLSSLLVTY